jgi:capsular exopolysaccharide synthesis family protein
MAGHSLFAGITPIIVGRKSNMLRRMYSENVNEPRLRSNGDYVEGVGKKKLDFQFYWGALLNNKLPIAFFTALMTTLAILYSLLATPIYSAKATLLLESQKANIISIEDLVSSEQESNDYYGTQYAVLRSRALIERVINYLDQSDPASRAKLAQMLAPDSADAASQNPSLSLADRLGPGQYNEVVNRFKDAMSVSPVVKTKLVTISYESPDPEFSAMAANAVANQYIEQDLEQRSLRKEKASVWMNTRVQELKAKLDASESALINYKKENDLVDVSGDVSRLTDQQLIFMSNELIKAKAELSNATDLYVKTRNYKSSSPNLLVTLPYVQSDVAVRSASADIERAQRELAELRNRYGAKHPIIIDANSKLASLRSSLNENISRVVATFENDYQLLRQRVASIEATVAQDKLAIQNIGQQKVSLEALEREANANREQYNRMFDRITEIRTTDGLDAANAVVSEAAWVQTNPIKPNKALIVGFVLLGSLLFAAIVACIKEYLDDSVQRRADIEHRLNSKLMGVIPLVESVSSKRNPDSPLTPVVAAKSSETFIEAVNTCRTAITISSKKDSKIILVTSSVPDEGKSTIALNLAYSFGKMERTLLIDCDLRKPSIGAALGLPLNNVGLTNLLLGKSVKPGIIKCNVMDAFDCLTSGPIPEKPLELLASDKFAMGLKSLSQHYDRIIIDCAPTNVVSDAFVLSRLADEVLYVVKPYATPIKLIDNGLARLAEAKASVVGICISQLDTRKSKSYGDLEFHGYGHQYYGYGADYFEQEAQPEEFRLAS